MYARGYVGCFFLDTNIPLAEILHQNNPRIDKLKKDAQYHNVHCYISESVEKEIEKKVGETTDFLGRTIKDTIRQHLENSRRSRGISVDEPMTDRDIISLERLFSGLHGALRSSRVGLPSPLTYVEEWVVSYLGERLEKRIKITIQEFIVELVKSVLQVTSAIQNSYDYFITFQKGFFTKKNSTLDTRIVAAAESIGLHTPDSEHIACAVANQAGKSEKTIFVTLDFSTILNKQVDIQRILGVECCDPLYAIHHLA